MPPKGKGDGKVAKPKTNLANDFHVDQDLKRLLDATSKLKCPLEPVQPFLKKCKAELQLVKDLEQFDLPNFPLMVYEPMQYDTCRGFFSALQGYPWLRQLSLLHCGIGDDGVMVIGEFLKQYVPHPEKNPFGIEVLELPENNIGPRGAGYLGKILTQNESLKVLNLDFNDLGDAGATLLGEGAKWNSTLEKLSLQYCAIGEAGAVDVAKYIVRSSSIKDLSLRGNPLKPKGVTAIARSLAKNAYLVKLDLADTSFGIDLETIEALRDGIEGNDSLEHVDLNMNSLVPAGVQLLLEMLKTKPKLQQFLVYERISDVVFRDVLDALAANVKAMKKKKKKGGKAKPDSAGKPPGSADGTLGSGRGEAPPPVPPPS
jgi:hypothetical protein